MTYGDLTLNFEETSTYVKDRVLDMGQVEFKILNCLIKHQGSLVDRKLLHSFIWGEHIPSERALDPHINSLRKKLRHSVCDLKTVYGKGFSLIITQGKDAF
ncbi:MAG: winged helix-turn-helix transcriptional regulator [Bdellovibrionales bacterium]|nr:winged helix-turn-helix transcriptional regulator [Bdellovibrionales bacterium]